MRSCNITNTNTLNNIYLPLQNRQLELEVIVDKTLMEVYANGGLIYWFANYNEGDPDNFSLSLTQAENGLNPGSENPGQEPCSTRIEVYLESLRSFHNLTFYNMKAESTWFVLGIILISCSSGNNSVDKEQEAVSETSEIVDYTSKVPQFTYPNTLEEQLEALKTNPLLKRFRESRKKLAADPHLPLYHFVSPENRLNDPNGLCYWQGRWHLFLPGLSP